MKWYKGISDDVPQGVLNFDHFMCCIEGPDQNAKGPEETEFKITIMGQLNRIFRFRTGSKGETLAWLQEIRRHIENSEGTKFNKSAYGLKKPWKFDNISEK
jgi:hypothetical protein